MRRILRSIGWTLFVYGTWIGLIVGLAYFWIFVAEAIR